MENEEEKRPDSSFFHVESCENGDPNVRETGNQFFLWFYIIMY